MSAKIAIIGAGAVGATVAYTLMIQNAAAKIVLIDIDKKKQAGEVMDMGDGLCLVETGNVIGGDFTDARDADIIIITAGAARIEGSSRLALLDTNKKIITSIFQAIGQLHPETIVIMVTNPVDILTYLAQALARLPATQVFGTGTALDTARLHHQLAAAAGVSTQNVHGYVIGEHGDSQVVAWSSVTIAGLPIKAVPGVSPHIWPDVENTVRREAFEIISRKGATFYGIALVVADIVDAIYHDQQRIIPVSCRLDDWNGVSDVCLGAPAVIGRAGITKIWPLHLTLSERHQLKKSAATLKAAIAML